MLNTELNIETSKVILNITPISQEQIQSENRDYNSLEWDGIILRLIRRQSNVKFFVARKQSHRESDLYYATYQISEGIIVFKEVSYISSLTSNGFSRITISETGEVKMHLLGNKRIPNTPENRKALSFLSKKLGYIYSNEF